jgi:hypothetical protein
MACNRRILILIASLVLLLALARITPAHAAGEAAVHYRIRTLAGHRSSYYTYQIKYPVFAGTSPLVAYANRTIQTWARKTLSDFRKEAVRDHETGPLAFGWETDATPEVGLSRSDIISLCFHSYYYAGGANGNESPKTFNFGLRNGKPALLQLSDVFDGPNPASTLSPVVISDLRKKQASSVLDGTVKDLATIDGAWGWYLKKGLIVVEIGQEAAGSHAEGTFTLNIPLNTFAGKLNTHGPLASFLSGH